MPTEHGYPDEEQVGAPHGNELAGSAGLSVPASPATVDDVNLGVAAYRSIVITATVVTHPVNVSIDWTMALDGTGVIYTTTTQLALGTSQRRITCAGRFIPTIRYSGSGGAATMDYTVVGSNIDPFHKIRYPEHQWIDLGAIFTFGNVSAGITMAVDALCWSNHVIQSDAAVGRYLTFYFLMGPQFARHEIIFTHNRGPNFGSMTPYVAKIDEDVAVTAGYRNPRELIANAYNGDPAPNWIDIGGGASHYAAATARNIVEGLNLRVSGEEGDPFTRVYTDSDGFHACDGGPGLYAFQPRFDTKVAASTAYKFAFSQLGVHRIDESGFL